jgi:hypothetical protein
LYQKSLKTKKKNKTRMANTGPFPAAAPRSSMMRRFRDEDEAIEAANEPRRGPKRGRLLLAAEAPPPDAATMPLTTIVTYLIEAALAQDNAAFDRARAQYEAVVGSGTPAERKRGPPELRRARSAALRNLSERYPGQQWQFVTEGPPEYRLFSDNHAYRKAAASFLRYNKIYSARLSLPQKQQLIAAHGAFAQWQLQKLQQQAAAAYRPEPERTPNPLSSELGSPLSVFAGGGGGETLSPSFSTLVSSPLPTTVPSSFPPPPFLNPSPLPVVPTVPSHLTGVRPEMQQQLASYERLLQDYERLLLGPSSPQSYDDPVTFYAQLEDTSAELSRLHASLQSYLALLNPNDPQSTAFQNQFLSQEDRFQRSQQAAPSTESPGGGGAAFSFPLSVPSSSFPGEDF